MFFVEREPSQQETENKNQKIIKTMTTPNKNGNGAKEVNTPQNNKTAKTTNGNGVKHLKTAIVPASKEEEKTTPKAVEPPKTETQETPPQKPKTLEEQINFFLGLEKLMNVRRRLETHLEAVQELEIEDEELTKFETGNNYGIRIELHDNNRREYNITNPRLVKEMQSHLISLLEAKIEEHDKQILTYGETETAATKS